MRAEIPLRSHGRGSGRPRPHARRMRRRHRALRRASAVPASLDARADVGRQRLTVSNWDGRMPEDLPARFKAAPGVP